MPQKLPVVSGQKLIKFLEKLGYVKISQRGSHVKLVLRKNGKELPVTVPLHKEIAKGTLNDILNAISRHTGKTKEELHKILAEAQK